jgi:hypothetical protein
LLLQGYINTLKAYATKSFQRGEVGDVRSLTQSSHCQLLTVPTSWTEQFEALFISACSDIEKEGTAFYILQGI